ncbi:hypothetical protein B0H14DRAFT_89124 [Mycena olivaceomarginata]|nr:hypothetical protein B0H14DRAFT_89124 [Mycena olivaceomarginata]
MTSILLEIRSRAIRYVGSRCYNEKSQPISCPISRAKLIAVAAVLGLFVLICLTLFILKKCSCNCRRRRNTMTIHYHYAPDPEVQSTVPPAYRQFGSSLLPTSPVYKEFEHSSASMERLIQPTRSYGYMESSSAETLVEPARIHPAVHSYPRY